jgi:hypothetical protein
MIRPIIFCTSGFFLILYALYQWLYGGYNFFTFYNRQAPGAPGVIITIIIGCCLLFGGLFTHTGSEDSLEILRKEEKRKRRAESMPKKKRKNQKNTA